MKTMRNIFVTGGLGFIGSCFVIDQINKGNAVTNLDKMTYAADIGYVLPLIQSRRIELAVGDVCDYQFCLDTLRDCDLAIHTAAESHVDRSFHSSVQFTRTNALGTHTFLEACRVARVPRIIHVSTDEVYGEVLSGECDENAALKRSETYDSRAH